MSGSSTSRAGLSMRDRRLILFFAFFVEVLILYMFLLDPLITRLGRARDLEAKTRHAHAELAAAMKPAARTPLTAEASASLVPLRPATGETATMAIQRALGDMAQASGLRMQQAKIAAAPVLRGGLPTHAVDVQLEGDYEALAAFIEALEAPEPVRGVEVLSVSTSEADPDRVQASMTFRYYLQAP